MMDSQVIPASNECSGSLFSSNNNNVLIVGSKKRVLLVKVNKIEIFPCNLCPKLFADVLLMEKHIEDHEKQFKEHLSSAIVVLERIEIHQCEQCPQCFHTKRDLVLHNLKHIHQNIKTAKTSKSTLENDNITKPYKCPDCDYSFAVESNLQAHSVLHKPYPHVCHCGVGYYRKQDLLSHEEIVHTRTKTPWQAKTKYKGAYEIKVETEPNTKSIGPKLRPELLLKSRINKKPKPQPKAFDGMLLVEKENRKFCYNDTYTKEVEIPKRIKKLKSGVKRQRRPVNHPNIDIQVTNDRRFVCPVCNKQFSQKEYVYRHYVIHTGERPYACDICDKRFHQPAGLYNHVKIHIGKKEFFCRFCEKAFFNSSALMLHERTHTGERPYKCGICEKAFSDPSAYKRHERTHTGDKRYQCPYCPKAFTDASGLIAHRKRHIGEKTHHCDECDKSFFTRSALTVHKKTHTDVKNFTCDYCNKSFQMKSNLVLHIIQHMGLGKTKCKYCEKYISSSSSSNMNAHIKRTHKDKFVKLRHACTTCGKRFPRVKDLTKHFRSRHIATKYECDYCGDKFAAKKILRVHILTRHVCIKCEQCHVFFPSLVALNAHRVMKKCAECGEEVLCNGLERIHRMQHKVTVKHECEVCEKVCYNMSDLKRHRRTHAPKPLVYTSAVDKFSTYDCNVCLKEFARKRNLIMHIDRCHNDEQYV